MEVCGAEQQDNPGLTAIGREWRQFIVGFGLCVGIVENTNIEDDRPYRLMAEAGRVCVQKLFHHQHLWQASDEQREMPVLTLTVQALAISE